MQEAQILLLTSIKVDNNQTTFDFMDQFKTLEKYELLIIQAFIPRTELNNYDNQGSRYVIR